MFYQRGLSVNVMYVVDDPKKRAVGFNVSDGMEAPTELSHPSGLSAWPKVEPGRSLLATGLAALGAHPVWRDLFPT